MISTEQQEQVLLLRAKNYSIQAIAKETKLNKNTVCNIIRANREAVEALYSIEMDCLLKEQNLTKRERLVSLGNILKNIEKELQGRDLGDVPTDKLLKMYLDSYKSLKEETSSETLTSIEEAEEQKEERVSVWR